jgi:hypothetical protein
LIAVSERTEISSLIRTFIGDSELPSVFDSISEKFALEAFEQIQLQVFKVTESCLSNSSLSVKLEEYNQLILAEIQIIQNAVNQGINKEYKESTILRQSAMISALLSPKDDI